MGHHIIPIKDDSEFDELCRAERKAFEDPYEYSLEFLFPLNQASASELEASYQENIQRRIASHRATPASTWVKAVDDATGELLGAANYYIFEADPFLEDRKVNAAWIRDEQQRKIANTIMSTYRDACKQYMRKEHIMLRTCFTAPDARRRGVGRSLLEVMVKEADRRGMDCYLNATIVGKNLYELYGFIAREPAVKLTTADFEHIDQTKGPDDVKILAQFWPMYRPVGGKFEEGKTKLPWST